MSTRENALSDNLNVIQRQIGVLEARNRHLEQANSIKDGEIARLREALRSITECDANAYDKAKQALGGEE